VCQVLNIIILCHIKYLEYFWCIKYQYINIYVKMGKENGKKKRKMIFLANWAQGNSAQPRARARPRGPSRPASGSGVGTVPCARAHVPARGGRR
jgi:hypothetical protein